MRRATPKVCPVCGEDVPPRALACPECGACHETGWREDAGSYDGLDLPDEAWGEDDAERERSGDGRRKASIRPFWRIVALLALLALFWWLWHWLFALGRAPWR
jgi:hypothetical protein